MATKVFDIQEVLKASWEQFKKNPFILIGLLLLSLVASVVVGIFFSFLPAIVLSLLNVLVSSYIMLSMMRAVLMVNKGETPDWSVLKNDINLYLKFFISSICLSIIFIIASILLLFPLLLAMALFFPVPYIIADNKDISLVDAFKRSVAITSPQFLPCIIFVVVMFILAIIGMIPLGLGLLIAIPVIYLMGAMIYKKLDAAASATTTAAAPSAQ